MRVLNDLHKITDNPNHKQEELKEFVGTLTTEKWDDLAEDLPKNPF